MNYTRPSFLIIQMLQIVVVLEYSWCRACRVLIPTYQANQSINSRVCMSPCFTNDIYIYIIYKAQIVCLSVCLCVCMYVRVWRPRLLSVCNRNRHAQRKVCVKYKKIMHRVPSRGIDSRVKFLDDANATHSGSFEHTPAPVLCRPYASPSFAKLRAIEYLLPTKLTLLALAFLSKF